MLSHISWHDYLLYIGAALIAYYVVVIILYYRKDLHSFLKKKNVTPQNKILEKEISETAENTYTPLQDVDQVEALEQLEAVSNSISEIADIFGEDANKEALILRIYSTLSAQDEPALLNQYRERIDWHIRQQVQLYNRITLTDDDLIRIWQFPEAGRKDKGGRFNLPILLLAIFCSLLSKIVDAQDGNAGITQATAKIKGYFGVGCDLMYAIGAVIGIVGAVKVFNKWNQGDPDTSKTASAWFGSCIFLVIVVTVLKSFFGV